MRGTTVDYMHCVLLGVCRQLLKLWLETKHSKELWYIGNKCAKLHQSLCNIKPPAEIKRTPRSIKTTRKFWKGNDKSSGYSYFIAVVNPHVLLIMARVHNYIYVFTGIRHMSANVHGLLHLPDHCMRCLVFHTRQQMERSLSCFMGLKEWKNIQVPTYMYTYMHKHKYTYIRGGSRIF